MNTWRNWTALLLLLSPLLLPSCNAQNSSTISKEATTSHVDAVTFTPSPLPTAYGIVKNTKNDTYTPLLQQYVGNSLSYDINSTTDFSENGDGAVYAVCWYTVSVRCFLFCLREAVETPCL
jgi:hypothetical protein